MQFPFSLSGLWTRLRKEPGITLLDALVGVAILSTLATVVIVVAGPRKSLLLGWDAERNQMALNLEHALQNHDFDVGGYPNDAAILDNEANAKPVCRPGIANGTDGCVSLDALVPLHIPAIPIDEVEPCPSYTGYKVFRQARFPAVTPTHLGKMPGDPVSSGCESPPACVFSVLDTLDMNAGENDARSLVIDPGNDFGYVAMTTGHVVKFRLSDMTRQGGLMAEGNSHISSGLIANGYAYFTPDTWPAKIAKIDLATFTLSQILSLPSANEIVAGIFDATNDRFLYTLNAPYEPPYPFVTVTRSPFQEQTVYTAPSPFGPVWRVLTDGTYAYMTAGNAGGPTKIYKYALANLAAGPAGEITLNADEVAAGYAFAIDPVHGFAYFTTYAGTNYEAPVKLVKIDLTTFTRAGAITLPAGGGGMVIDTDANTAFLAVDGTPGADKILKIDLATFQIVSSIDLFGPNDDPYSAQFDPATKTAYFTSAVSPGRVIKICAR